MTKLGEALQQAIDAKKDDVNLFIWKGPKHYSGGNCYQEEFKLIDADAETLQKCYDHCLSMLYSTDKNNPGRSTLLQIIKDQRIKCNTELYLRYVENAYLPSDRIKYPRFLYLQGIREYMEANKEYFPNDKWNQILVTSVTGNVPEEFQDLTIDTVINGCLDTLGLFIKKHVTLNFITKLGLWFSKDELKEFTDTAKELGKNRLDLVKERCNLKNSTALKITAAGLSYREFRAMVNLTNKKYSEMTTDQLVTLRDKVLFHLEMEVENHKKIWLQKIDQIIKVAEAKNITLQEKNGSI